MAPSATVNSWLDTYIPAPTQAAFAPADDVYSVVNVKKGAITVKSYTVGDPTTPVDSFTIVQNSTASTGNRGASTLTASMTITPTAGQDYVLADSTQTYTATLSFKDAQGKPAQVLDPTKVKFGDLSGALTFNAITDNGNGTYTGTFSSATAGTYTIGGTYQNDLLAAQAVTFTAAPPSAANSSLTVTPLDSTVTCGQTVTVQARATVRDTNNQPVSGIKVTFTYPGPGSPLVATSGSDGVAGMDLTLTASETPWTGQVSATIDDSGAQQPVGSPQTVTVKSTGACYTAALALTPATPVDANGVSAVTGVITVKTALGAAVPGDPSIAVNVYTDGTTTIAPVKKSEITDRGDGTYTFTLTSTTPGDFRVEAAWHQYKADPQTIAFAALQPANAQSALTPVAQTVVQPCDGTFGEGVVTATVRSADNYPVPNVPLTFTVGVTNPSLVQATTGADGTATIRVTTPSQQSTTAVKVGAAIDGQAANLPNSPVSIQFTLASGCVPAPTSFTFGVNYSSQIVGLPVTATVKLLDAAGQGIVGADPTKIQLVPSSADVTVSEVTPRGDGTYTATLNSTTVGNYTVALKYDGSPVVDGVKYSFINGPKLEASPQSLMVGKPSTVTLTLVDAAGTPYANMPVTFSVDGHATVAPTTKNTDANGVVTTTVTDQVAETVTVRAQAPGESGPVTVGEPVAITFTPLVLRPTMSISTTEAMTGEMVTVTMSVRTVDDQAAAGVTATFTATGAQLTPATCVTDGQGTCQVTLKATQPGSVRVTGAVEGQTVQGSPQTVTFTTPPPKPDLTESSITVDQASAEIGTAVTVTAMVKGDDGQPMSGVTVAFAAPDTSASFAPAASCVSGVDGRCQVTITDDKVERVSVEARIGGQEVAGSGTTTVDFTPVVCRDPGNPQLALSAATAVANGTDSVTATITGWSTCEPVDESLISLAITPTGVDATTPVLAGDRATATLTSTFPGAGYSVQALYDGVAFGAPQLVTFTQPPCVETLTPAFTITPTTGVTSSSADLVVRPVATVDLRSACHPPVNDPAQVTLTSDPAGLTLAEVAMVGGIYTAKLSGVAGTYDVTATFNGTQIGTAVQVTMTTQEPGPDPTESAVSAPATGEVGVPLAVTAMAKAQDGTARAGVEITFVATGPAAFDRAACMTDDSGSCTVNLTATAAGSVTVTAMIGDAQISGSGLVVDFTGTTCIEPVTITSMTITPASAPTGSEIVVVLNAQPACGLASIDPSLLTVVPSSVSVLPGAAFRTTGTQYMIPLSADVPADFTVQLAYDGVPLSLPTGTDPSASFFMYAPPPEGFDQKASTVKAQGPRVIQTGTAVTLQATVVNTAGAPIPGVEVQFSSAAEGVELDPACTTDPAGQCTIQVTNQTDGPVYVKATVGGLELSGSTVALYFALPGCMVDVNKQFTVNPVAAVADGESAITVWGTTKTPCDESLNDPAKLKFIVDTVDGQPTDAVLVSDFTSPARLEFTATLTSTTPGTYVVRAEYDGQDLGVARQITFSPQEG
ncbi:MAG: Ig-like domain-containing protein, partial [Propionibacteriaceae bacterium]|nr:Ig-like domain-containing protein [Propionibacteriaceae bacterium]